MSALVEGLTVPTSSIFDRENDDSDRFACELPVTKVSYCDMKVDDDSSVICDAEGVEIPASVVGEMGLISEHGLIIRQRVQEEGLVVRVGRRNCGRPGYWRGGVDLYLCNQHDKSFRRVLDGAVGHPDNAERLARVVRAHIEENAHLLVRSSLEEVWG